jgi:hypothetical protein
MPKHAAAIGSSGLNRCACAWVSEAWRSVAAGRRGQQEIHYDIVQYDLAIQCYTVILYLTPTLSTALPKFPLAELRGTFSDHEQRLPAAELKKLQRDQFDATRVKAGDALVLNCAVPHWGVNNPDTADRYVVFACFSPRSEPAPDTEHQRYPHRVKY